MALRHICAALARRAGSAAQQQLLPAAALCTAPGALHAAAAGALPANAAAATAAAARTATAAAFSTSGSALSDSLSSLLQRELKHEQTTYEKPEAVAGGPPAPFTLTSVPGDGTVSLRRDFNGEDVTVDASINLQEGLVPELGEGEEEDEEEYGSQVNFNVTVSKGDESLVFECVSDGTYVEISHVSHEPAGGVDSETSYTGPVFDELADPVREGFAAYLEARGVNEDLGEWLRHALYDKEQREYIGWLERVANFTK